MPYRTTYKLLRMPPPPAARKTADELIAEINQQLQHLQKIARAYIDLTMSSENSEQKVRLHTEYRERKSNLWLMFVGQGGINGISDKLEARNEALSLSLNQYLIDHTEPIERTAKAPAFMEYLMEQ